MMKNNTKKLVVQVKTAYQNLFKCHSKLNIVTSKALVEKLDNSTLNLNISINVTLI